MCVCVWGGLGTYCDVVCGLDGTSNCACIHAHLTPYNQSLSLSHPPQKTTTQAYAVAFFAIPAVRWVQNTIRNAGVARRNETRMSYLQQLANPGPALQAKLNAARRLATTTRVDDKNVVFRTDREVGQQVNEFEEFDQKLGGQPGREEEDDWRGQVFRRAQQRTPPR